MNDKFIKFCTAWDLRLSFTYLQNGEVRAFLDLPHSELRLKGVGWCFPDAQGKTPEEALQELQAKCSGKFLRYYFRRNSVSGKRRSLVFPLYRTDHLT